MGLTMTSTSRPPSSKRDDRRRHLGPARPRRVSSARRTNTPTMRRRYHSLAMPSVNGSHSRAAASAARRWPSASSLGADERAPRAAARGSGAARPRRARCARRADRVRRAARGATATVTTAGVLACLRPNLMNAVSRAASGHARSRRAARRRPGPLVMKPVKNSASGSIALARWAGEAHAGVEGEQGDRDVAARRRREQVAADRAPCCGSTSSPCGGRPRGAAVRRPARRAASGVAVAPMRERRRPVARAGRARRGAGS